jgi:uroporphyrinogen-III synthase
MSPLAGCRVLVTRERPGELAALLEAVGATVVHVPLIEVVEPDDGGAALRDELSVLDRYDWLVVTAAPGAERVAAAAADVPSVRLAAVGTTTANVLRTRSGRSVDVVPAVQHADALADELISATSGPQRMLLAHADRAAPLLAERLRAAGHDVTTVVAYRTRLLRPAPEATAGADALLLASGSSAEAWVHAMGPAAPPVVVAIGPMTAAVAERVGLKVSGVAADHSLEGLVAELVRIHAASAPGTMPSAEVAESLSGHVVQRDETAR